MREITRIHWCCASYLNA